jgi:hypothetical protein
MGLILNNYGSFLCQFCANFVMIQSIFWDDFGANFGAGFWANFNLVKPIFQGATGAVGSHEGLKQHKVVKFEKFEVDRK